MTGTGTQIDPYIVSTFGDFLTAIETSGAYVELNEDINIAEDETYKHGLTIAVNFNCANVDGNDHSITNIKITAINAVTYTGSVKVEHLKLLNWMHVAVNGNNKYTLKANSDNAVIEKCEFSFTVVANDKTVYPIYKGQYKSCGIYFTETSGSFQSAYAYIFEMSTGSEYNNIETHGFECKSASVSSESVGVIKNCKYSSIIGDCKISYGHASSGYTYVNALSECDYCLMCCTITYMGSTRLSLEKASCTNSYWCTDLCTGTFRVNQGGITSTNAKSQLYLTQIGFLP